MDFRLMLTLTFICFIALTGVPTGAVLPDLTTYNPLEGFTVHDGWKHYTSPRTPVVASAANLKNGDNCQRVIAFSVHGVVFDHYDTNCDSFDPRIGIVEAFEALWYFKEVLARQESDDKYTILFKTPERTCNKRTYTITQGSSQAGDKTETPVDRQNDQYCNLLADFKEPMMKLLSSQSSLGSATSMTGWGLFNIWEPLGVMTRLYRIGQHKVMHLLVLTSYGRVVEKLKASGGPMQGIVATENALYYGNVVMVKSHGAELKTFTILQNPNTGVCIKRTVTLSSSNGRVSRTRSKPEHIPESHFECQDLINKSIPGSPVSESQMKDLEEKLAAGTIDVKPFTNGLSIQGKEQAPTWDDRNLNQDLGVAVLRYKPFPTEQTTQIIMVAKGVPLAGILKDHDPRKIVVRKDHLYYDKDIMVKKGADENTFIVITRLNENSCSEKTYTLKSEGGKMAKEEKGEVNKTKDEQECKDLIEGNKFKNQEAERHVGAIDEAGLINYVEEDVKSIEADPQNTDL